MSSPSLLLTRAAERGRATTAGAALRAVPGVHMDDAWRGTLEVGAVHARLRIEASGWLRGVQPLAAARSAQAQLDSTAALPGSVRCAGAHRARVLLADAWLEGETHLARTIGGIQAGFEAGLQCGAGRVHSLVEDGETELTLELSRVESAIAALGWGEAAVVHLSEGGWELRPRLEGVAHPVRVEIAGARLRLHRSIALGRRARCEEALAELALRSNFETRLARLVPTREGFTVEAQLHADQLAPAYLAQAARAVAAASARARLPLQLVSEQERVAQCYADAFCAPDPRPTPFPSRIHP